MLVFENGKTTRRYINVRNKLKGMENCNSYQTNKRANENVLFNFPIKALHSTMIFVFHSDDSRPIVMVKIFLLHVLVIYVYFVCVSLKLLYDSTKGCRHVMMGNAANFTSMFIFDVWFIFVSVSSIIFNKIV